MAAGYAVHQDDPDEEEGGEVGEDQEVDGDADGTPSDVNSWRQEWRCKHGFLKLILKNSLVSDFSGTISIPSGGASVSNDHRVSNP